LFIGSTLSFVTEWERSATRKVPSGRRQAAFDRDECSHAPQLADRGDLACAAVRGVTVHHLADMRGKSPSEKLGFMLKTFAAIRLSMMRILASRMKRPGLEVLPKRWIVERTFVSISRNRRLARDFERHTTIVVARIGPLPDLELPQSRCVGRPRASHGTGCRDHRRGNRISIGGQGVGPETLFGRALHHIPVEVARDSVAEVEDHAAAAGGSHVRDEASLIIKDAVGRRADIQALRGRTGTSSSSRLMGVTIGHARSRCRHGSVKLRLRRDQDYGEQDEHPERMAV
jgi:hypothetical protein